MLNTVNDQLLSNVTVGFIMEPDDVWQVHSVVPLKELAYGKTGSCYVCLKYVGDGSYPVVQLANELKFKVHEVDPSNGQAEDDVRIPSFHFCGGYPSNLYNCGVFRVLTRSTRWRTWTLALPTLWPRYL